jgi:hypothetical protein
VTAAAEARTAITERIATEAPELTVARTSGSAKPTYVTT